MRNLGLKEGKTFYETLLAELRLKEEYIVITFYYE